MNGMKQFIQTIGLGLAGLLVGGDWAARAAEPDQLRHRDQRVFRGVMETEAFELHTGFGAVTIPMEEVATIAADPDHPGLVEVRSRHRNLLKGFVHAAWKWRDVDGKVQSIRAVDVESWSRGASGSEEDALPTRQFVILKNGDLVSGRILNETLGLEANGIESAIPLADLDALRSEGMGRTFLCVYRDGSRGEVQLQTPALRVELDLGPTVTLSSWQIEAIYCRSGFVPLGVIRTFDLVGQIENNAAPRAAPFPGMVWIPPGSFTMGSDPGEADRGSDEGPMMEVRLVRGFWMAQHEVTQEAYARVIGNNPSTFTADPQAPVEKVNWHEAMAYCQKLTDEADRSGTLPRGLVFRLPTEAEWEYACRAGSVTRFSYGDDATESDLARYAWYVENSDSSTHAVGQKEPNAWGLYDMHGNVWEWCWDAWQVAYPGGKQRDYRAQKGGWLRVARGGSWLYSAGNCRSANRDDYGPNNRCSDIGFRVVLAPPLR